MLTDTERRFHDWLQKELYHAERRIASCINFEHSEITYKPVDYYLGWKEALDEMLWQFQWLHDLEEKSDT